MEWCLTRTGPIGCAAPTPIACYRIHPRKRGSLRRTPTSFVFRVDKCQLSRLPSPALPGAVFLQNPSYLGA